MNGSNPPNHHLRSLDRLHFLLKRSEEKDKTCERGPRSAICKPVYDVLSLHDINKRVSKQERQTFIKQIIWTIKRII